MLIKSLLSQAINVTLVQPCMDICPSVAVAACARILTFHSKSVSVVAFPKMADSKEETAKECGSSGPLSGKGVRKIAVTGEWLVPGKETVKIRFYGHANSQQHYTVLFGSPEDGVEPNGYQLWVPHDGTSSFALALGFHYTNTATETLKPHWLVHAGRGIWRSPNHLAAFVLLEAHTHDCVPASLTDDLKPYSSLAEFEGVTGVKFECDGAKLLLKWCAPEKTTAYVMLRRDESVQYSSGDGRDPCLPHGVWDYFKENDGKEYLVTWFHWKGKRNIDGIPQAEATVLERMTDDSCMLHDVPVWRAVGTITHELETWMIRKFLGTAVREMKHWHIFVQVLWQAPN